MATLSNRGSLNGSTHRAGYFKRESKKQIFLLVVSALLIIYGIIFYYYPLLGWITAFQNYVPADGYFGSEFVGLDKFKFMFQDETFLQVIRNTIVLGILGLVASTVTAIAFALILNEVRLQLAKKAVQTISYLPHFLSWIVVTGIVRDVLAADGIVNEIMMGLGVFDQAKNFWSDTRCFWAIVTLAQVWKETGWNAIIYLAAITSIDPALYEAAEMDGSGRWGKIRYITLPSLRPTIMILLLINIGNVLNVGFEIPYLLGNDVIRSVSQTIDIWILKWGISQFDFSMGTAAGIFKSLVSIILVVLANQAAKATGDERLF